VVSFPYFKEPVRYTFISVNIRNNEVRALMAMYTMLKCEKLATKYPWIYGYFLQRWMVTLACVATG